MELAPLRRGEVVVTSRRGVPRSLARLVPPLLALLAARPAAVADVGPLTALDRQMVRPNVLILFDTSGSMRKVPGGEDIDEQEVGEDCDNGENCRSFGGPKTCYFEAKSCASNSDCTKAVWPNDFCTSAAATPQVARMCRLQGQRCRLDSDCTAIAGDTCVPATSKLTAAKRAVRSMILRNYEAANFGFMTFSQWGYFRYFPRTGGSAYIVRNAFTREALIAAGCYSAATGPAATCVLNGASHALVPASGRYRIHDGGNSFREVEAAFCGEICSVGTPAGSGIFLGADYSYTVTGKMDALAEPITRPSFEGKTITVGGVPHIYFDPVDVTGGSRDDHPKAVDTLGSSCRYPTDSCNKRCGGSWDPALMPWLDTTSNPSVAWSNALTLMQRLDRSGFGGLAPRDFTPSGCALKNDGGDLGATPERYSAYHYMDKVMDADPLACRRNYVLFVTDGLPTGPGDDRTSCASAACAGANPNPATCTCKALYSIKALKERGVSTFVIAFSSVVTSATGRIVMDRMAAMGGTTQALMADTEETLTQALSTAVLQAAAGSYSTSPSTSVQAAGRSLVLDARVDFPSWAGQLVATDVTSGPPVVAWNASTVSFDATADPTFWRRRNVWTSSGSTMHKIDVDPATGAIRNKATLLSLGLGATEAEAERIAKWMLGDPSLGNPAVLGAIINSTPAVVLPPDAGSLPGSAEFATAHAQRPPLIYVGSSNGMLHAFFATSTTIGASTYAGGKEAFAYIPPDMLPVITKLYAQNGQLPNPSAHVFGLANSPRVRDVCVSGCSAAATATWKSVLVMPEGHGGNRLFTLDVTQPFDAGGVKSATTAPPVQILWHSDYVAGAATYASALGKTLSLPAFYLAKSATWGDQRMMFTSGYGTGSQGTVLVNASALTGSILDTDTIAKTGACGAGAQRFTLLGDVSTARNYDATDRFYMLAGYFGDTWGNLWRYLPTFDGDGNATNAGAVSLVESIGCAHPIHFAPTVVQLDRLDPAIEPRSVFIAQVTNSSHDPDTGGFAASKLVIRKETLGASAAEVDEDFGTAGRVSLSADQPSEICAVTAANGSCSTPLPAGSRPAASPLGVLKGDGSGFLLLTPWLVPGANACAQTKTYLTLHEVTLTGASLKQAILLANEAVTNVMVLRGKVLYASSTQGIVDVSGRLSQRFESGADATTPSTGTTTFQKTSWQELP
jgi:hypothetical protein